jgi:hypothetical protein
MTEATILYLRCEYKPAHQCCNILTISPFTQRASVVDLAAAIHPYSTRLHLLLLPPSQPPAHTEHACCCCCRPSRPRTTRTPAAVAAADVATTHYTPAAWCWCPPPPRRRPRLAANSTPRMSNESPPGGKHFTTHLEGPFHTRDPTNTCCPSTPARTETASAGTGSHR